MMPLLPVGPLSPWRVWRPFLEHGRRPSDKPRNIITPDVTPGPEPFWPDTMPEIRELERVATAAFLELGLEADIEWGGAGLELLGVSPAGADRMTREPDPIPDADELDRLMARAVELAWQAAQARAR
jgi:hypothetical protein